jgi:hypothetical protein
MAALNLEESAERLLGGKWDLGRAVGLAEEAASYGRVPSSEFIEYMGLDETEVQHLLEEFIPRHTPPYNDERLPDCLRQKYTHYEDEDMEWEGFTDMPLANV